MVYGPGVSVCWCGSTQCFGGCRVSLTGAPSSASHRQPSPYSGDESPLRPTHSTHIPSVLFDFWENAPETEWILAPSSGDIAIPARRFVSRFRTRRHA